MAVSLERISPSVLDMDWRRGLQVMVGQGPIECLGQVRLRNEHLQRYWFATNSGLIEEGARVLDVACGIGYGRDILNNCLPRFVIGLDIDQSAVKYGKQNYGGGTGYIQGDAENLPFPSTCFNVIVSFETIEHLEYPEVYLEEICRVLTPRGTLIISTPNREVTNPGGSLEDRPKNPFHEREFSSVEFKALLENYFNQIRYYGQGFCRIGDGTLARRLKKLVNLQLSWRVISWPDGAEEQPTYILAVCRGKKIGF